MKAATALLAMLFCIPFCRAQDKPELNGVWKLNLARSDYGDMQGPNTRTDTIEQDGAQVRESVSAEGRNKVQQYILTFTTDGKETVYAKGAEIQMGIVVLQAISATWQRHALVVTEKLRFQDSDLVAKNTYELSKDGQTLTIQTSLHGEGTVMKMVFDKVPFNDKTN
jgi:hypothetical protein